MCLERVETRRKKPGSPDGRANLDRSSFRRISRGTEGERTNAGHDPTTTSFTELSAVRCFAASNKESEETLERGKKEKERKGERERERRRGKEESVHRAENTVINDSDFVSRRRRARVFDILPAFLLPDVFSILAQTIRSSLSDLPIQKRVRRRFLQPRGRNVRYACTSRVETSRAREIRKPKLLWRENSKFPEFFVFGTVISFVGIHGLKFYNYVFKKEKANIRNQ